MAYWYKSGFQPNLLLGMYSKICQLPSFKTNKRQTKKLPILGSGMNDQDSLGKEKKGPTEAHIHLLIRNLTADHHWKQSNARNVTWSLDLGILSGQRSSVWHYRERDKPVQQIPKSNTHRETFERTLFCKCEWFSFNDYLDKPLMVGRIRRNWERDRIWINVGLWPSQII